MKLQIVKFHHFNETKQIIIKEINIKDVNYIYSNLDINDNPTLEIDTKFGLMTYADNEEYYVKIQFTE